MKISCSVALAITVCFAGAAGPARADDAAAVKAKLDAAMAAVHSMVVDMEMSVPGAAMPGAPRSINMLITVIQPDRAKMIMLAGPLEIDSYQIDGMVYVHLQPGDSWRKVRIDPANAPAQVADLVRSAKGEKVALLPDRREDGMTVGVVQFDVALPAPAGMAMVGPPMQLTCSYDKTTYRMRGCANPTMSLTYAKFDDAANIIELPPAAAGAELIVPPSPPADDAPAAPSSPPATASPAAAAPPAAPTASPAASPATTSPATPSASAAHRSLRAPTSEL
jgi:hypothetical protein